MAVRTLSTLWLLPKHTVSTVNLKETFMPPETLGHDKSIQHIYVEARYRSSQWKFAAKIKRIVPAFTGLTDQSGRQSSIHTWPQIHARKQYSQQQLIGIGVDAITTGTQECLHLSPNPNSFTLPPMELYTGTRA